MPKAVPYYIQQSMKELRASVQRDSYDLTRDDHDAILHQIDILEQFIKERYASHGDTQCSDQCR